MKLLSISDMYTHVLTFNTSAITQKLQVTTRPAASCHVNTTQTCSLTLSHWTPITQSHTHTSTQHTHTSTQHTDTSTQHTHTLTSTHTLTPPLTHPHIHTSTHPHIYTCTCTCTWLRSGKADERVEYYNTYTSIQVYWGRCMIFN